MRPAYDLCDLCQTLAKECVNKKNVEDQAKKSAVYNYLEHLQKAAKQRDTITSDVKKHRNIWSRNI